MASAVNAHECQIATALDLSYLLSTAAKPKVGATNFPVRFLSVPVEGIRPCVVPEPVADVVSVTLF